MTDPGIPTGPVVMLELEIRACAAEVRPASHWLAQAGAAQGVPVDQMTRLDVCLNEVLANVMAHAGAQALIAPVLLRLTVGHTETWQEATVTVVDAGAPFDPTEAPAKSLARSLDDAEPGGLGLLMLRSYSDALHYRRLDDRNQLSFSVCWNND